MNTFKKIWTTVFNNYDTIGYISLLTSFVGPVENTPIFLLIGVVAFIGQDILDVLREKKDV